VDPSRVNTPAELAACLDGLRRRRGGLSYEAMEKAAAKLRSQAARSRWEPLGKSTVGEIVTGKRLPTKDKLRTFLAVCGVAPADLPKWLAAWERAATAHLNQPSLGVAVRQALASGAVVYEVHPSITVGDALPGELTSYVPRGHDRRLAEVVQAAIGGSSRIAVLVGASSTGKTRACWEALQTLPDNWRVWHPLTSDDLLTGLQTAGNAGPGLIPRTVIWLNELQRYLLPSNPAQGERVAAALRALLADPAKEPVLVLGSIWPDRERWAALSREPAPGRPDLHEQARKLLTGAGVLVPDRIGPAYADAQEAARTDQRWQLALRQDPDRPIQYLAGAAYLLQRYTDATPTERAVLDAAGDARRAGAPQQLPLAFLEEAARDYLPDVEWRRIPRDKRSSWVRDAIDDPATGLSIGARGVDGPLREPRRLPGGAVHGLGPVYELADYLEQHLRRERATTQPRDSLWAAAAAGFSDAATLEALATAALRRGRLHHAVGLFELAAAAGQTDVWDDLAELREQAGDRDGAQHAATQAAAAGYPHVWIRLARLRERAGDRHGAEQAYREAAVNGDRYVWIGLVTLLEQAGSRDRAQDAAGQAAAAGHPDVWIELAELRERAGDGDGAERAYRGAATAGETDVWGGLARLRERAGDRDGAEQIAAQAAADGHTDAWVELARAREQTGDRHAAEQAAQKAAAAGYPHAWTNLARPRKKAGDHAGAEEAYRKAVAAGDTHLWIELAKLREQAGDREGAEQACRRAAADGHTDAWVELARLLELTGDRVGAEKAAGQAAATIRTHGPGWRSCGNVWAT
jgi:tetratricopeptide (TPR) repeat protein